MRSGTRIAHYEVGELLGRGGMGDVYRARDTRLEREVALKFLGARYLSDSEAKARFIREAKAASALDHPNICTIHDIGETDEGELYIVMAFYEGRTLDALLGDGAALPPDRAERILRQLANALKRAHAAGIVHRDLKPANVMVGPDDAVRLLDFGIAKLQSEQSLTKTGATLGTAAWMSPEQASADPVTPATDVWSLGVIGYRLLTGRLPFEAENPLACLNQILTVDPPPVPELAPECPPHLAEAVDRALRKDPSARPADGAGMLDLLDRSGGVHAGPGRRSVGSGVRLWGAAVGIAIVATGIWGVWGGSPDRTDAGSTTGAGAPAISDDVVAILPFSVSGAPEFDYLAEGLMDLLNGRLDGAGPIRTVEPRAILAAMDAPDRGGRDGIGADEGSVLAARFGAGSFVVGQLVGLPGNVSISARIHVVATGEERDAVTVEGSSDSLFVLVDRLASGLLETSISGQNARIARRAAATSASFAATRAFLQGEQYHRRGQFDSASRAYNQAVEIDSTFALAHLMKSINNAYTYETDDLEAAEKAMRFSADLPERDRSLIAAFLDDQNGALDSAEEKYLTHLRRWPDEVKAMWQLGRLYTRRDQRLGRTLDPARSWLERLLEYEPESVQGRHQLARVDAIQRRFDRLPDHRDVIRRVAPGTEWEVQVETMALFSAGDPDAVEAWVGRYPELPLIDRLYSVHHAQLYAPTLEVSDRMLAMERSIASDDVDVGIPDLDYTADEAERLGDYTLLQVVLNDVHAGRHDAVRTFLRTTSRPGYDAPAWIMWEADLVVSDQVEMDPTIVERMLERVESVTPDTRMDLHFERLHDVFTPEVARLEQSAARARLLIRLGRIDEARRLRSSITSGPAFRGFASLREDVGQALEAELRMAAGDEVGALEILRGIAFQVSSTANALTITDGSHAVALRARLETRIGDPETARLLWEAIALGPTVPNKIYLRAAWNGLAELADARGDTAMAEYWRGKPRSGDTAGDP